MTLELIISQPQTQITGNPECDNIQNVPWIQANIQFLNTIKGVGISNIEKTSTVGIVDTYTITYTDGTTSTFDVTNGEKGTSIESIELYSTVGLAKTYRITFTDSTTFDYIVVDGAAGRGIVSILPVAYEENTVAYRIRYTDDTYTDFDVTNGIDGVSVESITKTETIGLVDTYEIVYSTGIRSYFYVTNGADGKGIVSIIKTSTVGLVDTYTITYSDSTTSTFDVTNGENQNEANIIEEVQVNGTALPVTNKSVNVVVPTQASDIGSEPANANIQQHISDETIHHTTTELDGLYEPKNSNIQEHIADTDIHHSAQSLADAFEPKNSNIQEHIGDATKHIDTATAEFSGAIDETNDKFTIWDNSLLKWIRFSFTSLKTFIGTYFLKLDQTTPQTITGNVNINGNLNAVTTNVNQSTLPSVNASQDAAILQDGSSFTGTDYVMPTNNVAVKFVASAAHTMGDFTVRVKSSATLTSTTATLTGYLYSDSAGIPSTLLATGNSILHGSITTSYQELSLGTQYNLVAGTTYWLVIRWSSAPTGGNIVFDSNTDTNGGATSSDAVSWTLTNVRLRYRLRGRTFYGINAFSTNSYGINAFSINSYGVNGFSTNNIGVRGTSTNNIGVAGISTNNYGVYGESTNSFGVRGISTNNYGVYGQSTNSVGVFGRSTNNRAGYFSRNTATPTNAVPVVEIIQDHASDTNSVLDVKQDGTGEIVRFFDSGVEVASVEKGGLGVYKKGVVIGDNTDVASYDNRGATRYRENAGGSFYEMVMKQTDGSYKWQSIVFNQ